MNMEKLGYMMGQLTGKAMILLVVVLLIFMIRGKLRKGKNSGQDTEQNPSADITQAAATAQEPEPED